jgi:hypothetical protein
MSRTRWVLAALLAGCLLAACSDHDPKPDIADPTPSTTTSPASTSSPPAATSSPALNPQQTVQSWVGAWNDALKSGDTRSLHRYETPNCRNCEGLSGVIDDVVSAGGSFSGGAWSIASSKTDEINAHRVKVNTAINVGAGSTVNSAGEDPVHFPADKRIVVYELEASSGTWLIDVIELLS